MSQNLKYRPDIDGLRAVAIIPVMLFHTGFGPFTGGYIGVDIFFVISGFLMTTIIYRDVVAGSFSYLSFYERRARRILPALYFTVLISFVPAWFLLIPSDFIGFSENVIGTVGFFSNITLWLQSDYFDQAAELKPLLHTWSLAVEEQYYLFIPVLLMVLFKINKHCILLVVFIGTLLSLFVSHWGISNKPTATYYLLPTRAWELLLGSIVALLKIKNDGSSGRSWTLFQSNALSLTSILLIVVPIFVYTKETPFPGLWALPPTLGTSLLILYPDARTLVYRLLANRYFIGIGLISYSAYLWHQPVYAFTRHQVWVDISPAVMMGATVASLFLAYLSWRYVEKPFRNRHNVSNKLVWKISIGGAITLALLGFITIKNNGFEDRFELRAPLTQTTFDLPKRSNGWCFYSVDTNPGLPVGEAGYNCQIGNKSEKPSVLLFGDSYAAMYEPFWDTVGKRMNIGINAITTNWCYPSFSENFWWPAPTRALDQCINNRGYVENSFRQYQAIVLSATWSNVEHHGFIEEVYELVREIAAQHTTKVIIMAQPPALEKSSVIGAVYRSGRLHYSKGEASAVAVNQKLSSLAEEHQNVYFLDRDQLFSGEHKDANLLTNDGIPYSWDGGHISIYGSEKAGESFSQSPKLKDLEAFLNLDN